MSNPTICVACPAKLNAVLRVGPQQANGYHRVASVLWPLWPVRHSPQGWVFSPEEGDTLTYQVLPTHQNTLPQCQLTQSGNPALAQEPSEQNLVVKAYKAFQQAFPHLELPSVSVHLHKRWPIQGGLGAGSSNAAAMLAFLAQQTHPSPNHLALQTLAATLGSDVPFFLTAQPALATDRGQQLQPLNIHPKIPALYWLLVKPRTLGISTPWAYQALDEGREHGTLRPPGQPLEADCQALIHQLLTPPKTSEADWIQTLGPHLVNDFQPLLWQHHSLYPQLSQQLHDWGAQAVVLCGSGATVAGLFHQLPPLATVAKNLNPNDYWVQAAITPWAQHPKPQSDDSQSTSFPS
ncbi:MAG: hypothetical protein U0003_02950 [Vampirovibrionales bacterium]